MLQAAGLVNGDFENGLQSWTVKGAGASIDHQVFAVGKASLRITLDKPVWQRVFQEIEVEPNATYCVEYLVKYQDVVAQPGAKFGGGTSWVGLKKQFPQQGIGGGWKLNVGNQDWTKVAYTFTTSAEDKKVAFQLRLANATGTVWFDDVKITKVGEAPRYGCRNLQDGSPWCCSS